MEDDLPALLTLNILVAERWVWQVLGAILQKTSVGVYNCKEEAKYVKWD